MLTPSLDFHALTGLAGFGDRVDAPCPLCGPRCRTRANANKRVLRIWRGRPDFATYSCARCGEHGWASDRRAKPLDRAEIARRMQEAAAHHEAEAAARKAKARWLWAKGVPAGGTVVARYLAGRGIPTVPPALRLLPARGDHAPAMMAAFGPPEETEPGHYGLDPERITAVHLTRLRPDGSGKAPDGEGRTKIMIGRTEGWPIALWPPNDGGALCVAEGIENALSVNAATGTGAWAAGAAVRLPMLAPLLASSGIEHLTVMMDDDRDGRARALELAARLARAPFGIVVVDSGGHRAA
jgi:hypothetical protein